MKYLKISLCLALFLALVLVSPVKAQVAQVELTKEARATLIAELNVKLLELYQMLITALTTQMQTQTAQMTTAISAVNDKVDQVVTNTNPVVGAVVVPSEPETTLTITPICIELRGVFDRGYAARTYSTSTDATFRMKKPALRIKQSGSGWEYVKGTYSNVSANYLSGLGGYPNTETIIDYDFGNLPYGEYTYTAKWYKDIIKKAPNGVDKLSGATLIKETSGSFVIPECNPDFVSTATTTPQ